MIEALDQLSRARDARAAPSGSAVALDNETRAALVTVCACAFALDALRAAVIRGGATARSGKNRGTTIFETLKGGFHFRGSLDGHSWSAEFKWLYDLRDAAVHFGESDEEPVLHPSGMRTGTVYATYSLEAAERAVVFSLGVFRICADSPKPPLAEWSSQHGPYIATLLARYETKGGKGTLGGTTSGNERG